MCAQVFSEMHSLPLRAEATDRDVPALHWVRHGDLGGGDAFDRRADRQILSLGMLPDGLCRPAALSCPERPRIGSKKPAGI